MEPLIIFCQSDRCRNVTLQSSGFCYKHSGLIPRPYILTNVSTVVSLESLEPSSPSLHLRPTNSTFKRATSPCMTNNLVSETYKESSSTLTTNSHISSLYKDVSKDPTPMCSMCGSRDNDLQWLYCYHSICFQCLNLLRLLKCPQCDDVLRGPGITLAIEGKISERQQLDQHHRLSLEAIANEQDIMYDPNQEYLSNGSMLR
jgi:hypothetical protein